MVVWFNPNKRLNFQTLGLFFRHLRTGFLRSVSGPFLVPGGLEMQRFLL